MKALLVIDMLNEFIYGEDLLINIRDRKRLIKNIKAAIEKARKNKIPLIYVSCSHTPEHPCVNCWKACDEGHKRSRNYKRIKTRKG
jgi:nicotinamidase-related amidase